MLALIAFVMLEARLGRRAMMPLALFGTRSFVGVSVLTLFLYAALGGMVVLLPYLLIRSGGYSAAAAGAALLPLSIAMGLGSRAAGRLAERIGARVLLGAGPVVAPSASRCSCASTPAGSTTSPSCCPRSRSSPAA